MGTGLRLMEALLTSEESTKLEYERKSGERNGGIHRKDIVTLFGTVKSIPREYYWNSTRKDSAGERKCGHYVFDERLGLVGRYTPAVVNEVLRLAATHDYEEAAVDFSKAHGFPLSPDTLRDIVLSCAAKVGDFMQLSGAQESEVRQPLAYVLADGTGIHMFHKYLEGVKGKKGAPTTREVKLAAFFTGEMKKAKPFRHKGSTTYVATTERWEDFGRLARVEYDRRFPLKPIDTIFLTDGGKWLRSVHDNFFPFATMILDLFHALEHLKEIMSLLGMREGSEEWKNTYRKWKRTIKAGRVKSVIKQIEDKVRGSEKASEVDKKLNYYRENIDRMHYDEYILKGWFVGSGVVESGCKCVVKQRLGNSGMHWSLKGAEPVLGIRALYKSNRLEEFCNWMVKDLRQVRFLNAA